MKEDIISKDNTENPVGELKTEKKKLLVIAPRNNENMGGNLYSFSRNSLSFAFVSSEEHKRTQCTSFMSCREYINRCFQAHIMQSSSSGNYSPVSDAPIDTNKLRLLVATGTEGVSAKDLSVFKQSLFNAKAGINRYEELEGWKKSVICTVKHKVCRGEVWMITAPKEWISQPQLLSTFVLLLRFICLHPTIDTTSVESIHTSMIELATSYEKAKNAANRSKFIHDGDIESRFHNNNTIRSYAFLIKSAEELFKGVSMEDAWHIEDSDKGSFLSTSGIDRFMGDQKLTYSDTVTTLQKTFKDMLRKHNASESKKEIFTSSVESITEA